MKSLLLGNPGQWRATEGNLSFGLITQRSQVQILPPQPNPLNNLQESHSSPPAHFDINFDIPLGIPFLVCHLQAGEVNGGPAVVTSVYAGTECTSMRKERSGGTPCFWCAQRSGTSAPGCNGDWQSWRRRPGCRRETGALSSGFYEPRD